MILSPQLLIGHLPFQHLYFFMYSLIREILLLNTSLCEFTSSPSYTNSYLFEELDYRHTQHSKGKYSQTSNI